MRRTARAAGLVLLVGGAFALGWFPLPYYAVGPGPAREVIPLIHVDGAQTFASAGVMWAIGLYDLLTPGDLTRGRTIAGTGAIDVDGKIGPIGGVRDKVVAARDADADILLVPKGNLRELRGVERGDLRVIAVSTFDEAVAALRSSDTSA